MRTLLLLSALVLPPREANLARVSVRADTDSVVAVGIITDLAAAFDEVARRHGYDPKATVDGWLEPSYLAFPSKRPDVAEYFVKREAYASDLAAHMDSIAIAVVQRRLDAAGYPVMQKDEMREAFLRGFHKNGDRQRMLLESMQRQARVALKLHDFLIKAEPRIAIDPKKNTLVFERDLEARRYHELSIAIDAANDQLARAAGPASGGAQ